MCGFVPKKWWLSFFDWSINATSVTAWGLSCKIHGNNIPLLQFSRELVVETLVKYGENRPKSLNTSGIAEKSIKLDSLNHVVVKVESNIVNVNRTKLSA